MRRYTYYEFDKILRKNNFVFVRQTGGHYIYKREGKETVVIPRVIQEPISQRLIKQHRLNVGRI